MPRDRKAIAARKKRARQEARQEEISDRNEYGYNDPTAYQAIKNITREEQKTKAAHRPQGM
jgi:hypothetical protein